MTKILAVIDTNVVVSGMFWQGPPSRILESWFRRDFVPLLSTEIVDEYRRVTEVISVKKRIAVPALLLDTLLSRARFLKVRKLPAQVCSDPDDDKFIALAAAAGADFIVSGDRALLLVGTFEGSSIVTASHFLSRLGDR